MSKGGNVFRPSGKFKIVVSGKDEIKIEIYSRLSKIRNFLNIHSFFSIMLFYVNFFTCHVILCHESLMRVSFCILLFNVLAIFNFEVMNVHRSFPYFSKVEFHVVYFFFWIDYGFQPALIYGQRDGLRTVFMKYWVYGTFRSPILCIQ